MENYARSINKDIAFLLISFLSALLLLLAWKRSTPNAWLLTASKLKLASGVFPSLVKVEEKTIFLLENATCSKKSNGASSCDYAQGEWVIDERLPLYSGFGCKQWLSRMWACRLMQRKDFSYEKLRWKPKNCSLEEFHPSIALKRLRGKTLAFIGDSLGREQFQSLMCMLTRGEEGPEAVDVGKEYGLVKAPNAIRPEGWAYRFPTTNTTILFYWSACLCELEPINKADPVTDIAMHLDRPPPFLRQYIPKFDVLVLNTGHHWNRDKLRINRWVMYKNGTPYNSSIDDGRDLTIHAVVHWVDSHMSENPGFLAFYRTISPRHYNGGDWNTGGGCNKTSPTCVGVQVSQSFTSDYAAGHAIEGTGVSLLDVTALSRLRDEAHISKYGPASQGVQDCLHWCLPGVPDTWNEILLSLIKDKCDW